MREYKILTTPDGLTWLDGYTNQPVELDEKGASHVPVLIQSKYTQEKFGAGVVLPDTPEAARVKREAAAARDAENERRVKAGLPVEQPRPAGWRPQTQRALKVRAPRMSPEPTNDRMRYVQGFRAALKSGGKEAVERFKMEWKAAKQKTSA